MRMLGGSGRYGWDGDCAVHRTERPALINLRNSLALVFVTSVFGCRLITDCTYETRYVRASGTIIENGVQLARAEITVSANRGSLTWKSVDRAIDGTVKDHVLAIRLARSDQPGISLLDIPIDPPGSPFISGGTMIQRPADQSPALGGIYELVASGQAVVEIDTDLSSTPRFSIPLSVTEKSDWYRPNCY